MKFSAPRRARWPGAAAAACAAALLWCAPSAAQTVRDSAAASRTPSVSTLLPAGPLLDAPVSRSEYLLGPGDVLSVAIFGDVNQVETVAVSPEGSALVPGLGSVTVLGLNLDQAERRIAALAARFYINPDVTVNLARVRSFKVYLVGSVAAPGVRTATATTRVSELVPPGGNGLQRRNVVLRRAAGPTEDVDLVRFVQTGDLRSNPMLREGDALVVPTVDETVNVVGTVQYPGAYEFRRGESLAELLSIANGAGPFPARAADTVRVSRVLDGGGRQVFAFSRGDALGGPGRGFVMVPFDAVFISEVSNFREQKLAQVSGEVRNPGTYPITPDSSTVRDLIEMAGGLTPNASLARVTLRRPEAAPSGDPQAGPALPAEALTSDDRRVLAARAATDATLVSFDAERGTGPGQGLDQRLRGGDVLTVPERRDEVVVAGAVTRPGIVEYTTGASALEYVQRAGWLSRRGDWNDATVIRARTGARLLVSEVESIEPGDTIVVPFRNPTNWTARFQAVSAIATAVTGLILSAIAVF